MTVLERNIEAAITEAQDFQWLRAYLRGIVDANPEVDAEILGTMLRHLYEHFRNEGDERAADLCLEGLDLVTGWVGPDVGLSFHTQPA